MSEEHPTRLEQVEKLCCDKGITIMKLEAELQRLKAKENEVCEWRDDNDFTQCGYLKKLQRVDVCIHCPYCGKKIKIV